MIGSRARAWFKELSIIGKAGVIGGGTFALLVGANTFAEPKNITYGQQKVTESVSFTTTYQDDDNMLISDPQKVLTAGVNGSQKVTYKITYSNGKETKRDVLNRVVIKEPVAELKARGTKEITTETATVTIPFGLKTVNDSTMDKGTTKITTAGVDGSKTVTYQVTKIKGQEVARTEIGEQVTQAAVTQITALGTKINKPVAKVSSSCDPNYSGGCVPIASDVDCGGGSGNGPAYFYGTARVVGSDIYGLDRDGDGIACE